MPTTYFIGHMGLGDVINYIGAIRFICSYYDKVHIVCFKGYTNNLKEIFSDLNVEIINTENDNFDNFLLNINDEKDIIVSGGWKNVRSSKITNENFLNAIKVVSSSGDGQHTVPWDFIKDLYSSISLNLEVYYKWFYLKPPDYSKQLYDKIKDYNIIFTHFNSHNGQTQYPIDEWPWVHKNEYLIIDPHHNHYNQSLNPVKYSIVNEFLNLSFLSYYDIIVNASQLYVVDSSFGALIHILKKLNIVKGRVIIYDRKYPNSTQFTPIPLFFGETPEYAKYIVT
jgi:hypothetical protein